jgi:MoxR-like ATPase
MALSTGCTFKRIQFVPDLLPSDITGTNIYNQQSGAFEFHPGPIMAQMVLADEINRSPSKSQAALLESMEESQATVDGVTYPMPNPFFVIATLNPIEYHGIFPLPEAQLDRFIIRINLEYASFEEELAIIDLKEQNIVVDKLESVSTPEDIIMCQQAIKSVYVDQNIRKYIVNIMQASRQHQDLALGASHRGSLDLFKTAQALALIRGREFVLPDDVRELSIPVLSHRILTSPQSRATGLNGEKIVTGILDNLPIPGI